VHDVSTGTACDVAADERMLVSRSGRPPVRAAHTQNVAEIRAVVYRRRLQGLRQLREQLAGCHECFSRQ